MNQEKNERISELNDRVYITRKCHINAAERYKEYDTFSSYLNIYYSAILIIISIIGLNSNSSSGHIAITTSVLMLAISMFLLQARYKEKYTMFKESYHDLSKLYFKTNALNEDQYDLLSDKYNSLLEKYENHSLQDYEKSLANDKLLAEKLNKDYYLIKYKVKLRCIIKWVKMIICLLLPFIVPYFIKGISFWISYTY